ncbi:hypothetical protein FACUT_6976 [Fusarium acutatum]|uniref:Uncharacterized protein n=1 Tax=Fusarium acutatum TaxID=78861 RepID=A0A8H4JP58_9HYPO|nr:hypothetical protein FACUT_6976 [Fusarium acutatum]
MASNSRATNDSGVLKDPLTARVSSCGGKRLLDCIDYVEEFWAIGQPVSLLPMSLQERALKLSTPPSCRDHKMAQALNIEGIDSSIILLVAGSGLAEPGVDILVQQRVCKLGRVGK